MTVHNQIEQARQKLLASRQPFEDALEALKAAEMHCDYLRNLVMRLFQGLNREWENGKAVDQWLKEGRFPYIDAERQPQPGLEFDFRIDGALTHPNSLLTFLRENMTANGPTWEPSAGPYRAKSE